MGACKRSAPRGPTASRYHGTGPTARASLDGGDPKVRAFTGFKQSLIRADAGQVGGDLIPPLDTVADQGHLRVPELQEGGLAQTAMIRLSVVGVIKELLGADPVILNPLDSILPFFGFHYLYRVPPTDLCISARSEPQEQLGRSRILFIRVLVVSRHIICVGGPFWGWNTLSIAKFDVNNLNILTLATVLAGGPCIKCSAGKYNLLPGCTACTNQTDTDCINCEEGTASTTEGRDTKCDTCLNGTYSAAGSTACTQCAVGTYSGSRAKSCTGCPLGWWAAVGSAQCTACPPNTYLNIAGQGDASACRPCAQGTYTTRLGNSDPACSSCPAGSFQQGAGCSLCVAGSYSNLGSALCLPCLAGTYSLEGATACVQCPKGTFSATNLTTDCTSCATGTFSVFLGQTVCAFCAQGSYTDIQGADTCSMCKYGEYAAARASTVSVF